jgi:tetratricopeptide (TPR) repeat protein
MARVRVRSCSIALLLLALAASGGTQAQTPEHSASATYRDTVEMATEEFNLGNYTEARALFEKAHALSPSARTLRGLGLAEFELRNYPRAVEHLEAALATEVKALAGEVRESTVALLHRAEGYTGRVMLGVEPASAQVSLNGQPLEHGRDDLVLSVGDHVFEFSATGYASQRRTVHVASRASTKLQVALQGIAAPKLAAESAAATHADVEPTSVPVYKRWWLWTTLGVVAAGAAVATVFLVREPKRELEPYDPAGAGDATIVFARRAR